MGEFFKKNKIFIAIIIAALIIGGFIFAGLNYFAEKTASSLASLIGVKEIPATLQPQQKTEEEIQKSSQCIDYTEAPAHVGEHQCVTGRVNHVYTSPKGNIFINFCADYRTCPFVGVIFSSEAYKFPEVENYKGKIIEITGLITSYKGKPEIVIDEPTQIKIR